jgi:hypothetical protein
MEAGRGRRQASAAVWRTVLVIAMLSSFALAATVARAGDYDTVGADGECFEKPDNFRDLDGNGCPEPVVSGGDPFLRFVQRGNHGDVRVTVTALSVIAPQPELVVASCVPKCSGKTRRLGGRRVAVDLRSRTFHHGDLVGVRVLRDGFVGRFFGYRIAKRHPIYMACLLRSPTAKPKRCHS